MMKPLLQVNLNQTHGLLFFPVPKTGCTSVLSCREGLFQPRVGHVAASHVRREYPEIWSSSYKFAIVRNPWDRLVSAWSSLRDRPSGSGNTNAAFEQVLRQVKRCKGFAEFVHWLAHEGVGVARAFHLQVHWTCDQGESLLDFVGYFEQLQQDWDTVCDHVGLSPIRLPHRRLSNHPHYTQLYDEETKKIVQDLYAEDIEQFKYKFLGRRIP